MLTQTAIRTGSFKLPATTNHASAARAWPPAGGDRSSSWARSCRLPAIPRFTARTSRPITSTRSSAAPCGPTRFWSTAAARSEPSICPAIFSASRPGMSTRFRPKRSPIARSSVIKRSAVMALAARDNDVARQMWALTARELQRVQDHIAGAHQERAGAGRGLPSGNGRSRIRRGRSRACRCRARTSPTISASPSKPSRARSRSSKRRGDRAADLAPDRAAQPLCVGPSEFVARPQASGYRCPGQSVHEHQEQIAMSLSIQTKESPVSDCWLVRKWRNWQRRRKAIAEIRCCGRDEVERLARDVGVIGADLCVLAGKWPDSTNLLSQRLERLDLDTGNIEQMEPYVLRDLQRVCTLCASKRRCERDLAVNSGTAWEEYCPNASTLHAFHRRTLHCEHVEGELNAPGKFLPAGAGIGRGRIMPCSTRFRATGPRGAARVDFRPRALRAMPLHRQGQRESARYRAAVSHVASKVSHRKPATAIG